MPRLIVASAACGRHENDSLPLRGGLTALVRTLAWVLLAAGSNTTSAARVLTTAGSRQARAIGQRRLRGELAISFRNDFIAHAGTSR